MTLGYLRPYGAFVRIAWSHALRARAELYGRAVFFVVILGVFTSLWRAVAEAGMPIAAEPRSLVWYLALTEWIVLSVPPIHVEVQETIRRGDIVCQLGRPVSWVGAMFFEGMGLLFARAPILFVTAWVCAWSFTGWTPPLRLLALVLPVGLAAAALVTALQLGLGILAFWLGDIGPVSWVWQKLLFVFGGLLMPIQLYPAAVRAIAPWTPFPAVLSGPASIVIAPGVDVVRLVRDLVGWSALTGVMLVWLSRRAIAALEANGG